MQFLCLCFSVAMIQIHLVGCRSDDSLKIFMGVYCLVDLLVNYIKLLLH